MRTRNMKENVKLIIFRNYSSILLIPYTSFTVNIRSILLRSTFDFLMILFFSPKTKKIIFTAAEFFKNTLQNSFKILDYING